ncbi:MAG TPA: MerR family transcriptional regulator, partial [Anaerovoracaceae bacterium]|nr:MerR family transcriptional regulator [Anaerovoracaceae bacterium]
MTLLEASKRFNIEEEKLQYYEKNGLFDCHKQADGTINYCDETLEYISLIDLLLKAGLDMDKLKVYLNGLGDDSISNEEQIKILIKQRYALLDDIHDKERILNQLDYIIHE